MTPAQQTELGIVALVVAIFAFDVWRDRSRTASTISELFWGLMSTALARRALMVGLALGVVLGHLFWQSQRTYRDIACERAGGYTQCVGAHP